jgi:hypothetical protein
MVQPLAPTIPRGCWLQVLPEEPQEAPKRCWRAAGCYEVNLRQGEATLCTPPDPTIQNQQWENCHRLQSIPAIGREAALQSQCSERMYAGAAAGLLRNEAMLIWESCRRAGQKELSCKLQELPRFAKGHQILGHSVASGADLPRTSTNSYSSHTSSRELFRCSRGPADTHDAIQHAHRSPVFKAAPHTVLYPGPISPHPYPCSRSTTRCPRHPIVLRSASSSSEISSLLK